MFILSALVSGLPAGRQGQAAIVDMLPETSCFAPATPHASQDHDTTGEATRDRQLPDASDWLTMPSRAEIVSFDDSPPPPGADPWVPGSAPATGVEITDPDPDWPRQYRVLAARIRKALGWRVLQLEHVGSTSVPGLPAKPIIDIDLTVADPGREQDYMPALETIGFGLTIREPWWYGHRVLRAEEPRCNLHVFGFDGPEQVRHRIFRDWLRDNSEERDRYAAAKRQAASEANMAGEHVMQYNARKQQVIREIYHRAFVAAGLLRD